MEFHTGLREMIQCVALDDDAIEGLVVVPCHQNCIGYYKMNSERNCSEMQKFSVLYYKRKNKVHKSKGVSKVDGILTIHSQSSMISLTDTTGTTVLAPRWEPELAKQDWQENDLVNLGTYEVEIVSSSQAKGPLTVTTATSGSHISKRPVFKPLHPLKTRVAGSLPTQSRSTIIGSSKTGPKQQVSEEEEKHRKRPLAQLPPSPTESTASNEMNAVNMEPCVATNHTFKKKRLLQTTRILHPKRTVNKQQIVKSSQNGISAAESLHFPDAIGTIDLPHSIATALKPHQRTGVTFIWNCVTGNAPVSSHAQRPLDPSYKGGCILADEMGLGKTIMTISAICALYRQKRDSKFIIVCPSSLVSNWANEFDKWLGKACQPKRIIVQKGGNEALSQIKVFGQPQSPPVLIVSYDILRRNVQLFQGIATRLLVVDEGHRLKNTNGSLTLTALESILCESRLLLTATPIQNVLSDFYTIANFCCPGLLGDLNTFRREFERPISAANQRNCSISQKHRGTQQAKILDEITKTFMIRRLQKDVLQSMLPPRQEVLLFCRPSKVQCALYHDVTRSHPTGDALSTLTSLRQLCLHPSLMNSKGDNEPVDISVSGKLETLDLLLREIRRVEPDGKVVVVSNFTSALSLIEYTILKPQQLTYVRLDGSTELANRHSIVDTFNKTSAARSFCFLLSSKAGGCGLNLIGANRLIMVDPDWNPASDIQAMARIYRHGQQKPCTIYRLFTSGTVEEVICQRQIQKGNLASRAVDSKRGSLEFSKEDLQDCFTLKMCDCDTKRKLGKSWPSYDGAPSILSQGCADAPLLSVARTAKALAFVHVVQKENAQQVIEDVDDDGDIRSITSEEEWQEPDFECPPRVDDTLSSDEGEYEFE